MKFHLYKISGYEEAIMSLRMSKGKHFSLEIAQQIQDLVYVLTDKQGFISPEKDYRAKCIALSIYDFEGISMHPKIKGEYEKDLAEFERLLGLTFNNAMKDFKHHTLMKYIDVSFITDDLHRGAQDDLDSHAIAFNNRITRFSTRLAEIDKQDVSEWYSDKVIPFSQTPFYGDMPEKIDNEDGTFVKTPFGWVLEKYAQVPAKNGLAKDVQRGLMALGTPGPAMWKTDFFNLRYVYKMRSKLTKASPELKIGMEELADQIEKNVPVFGPYFRREYTDSGVWEHQNKVRTVSNDEYTEFKKWKKEAAQ